MSDDRSAHDEFAAGDLAFTRESPYGSIAEASYAGALSFARRRYSKSLDDADLAVVGVPLDLGTTNRSGARLGPRAIRAASAMLAWERPWGWDFDPFERLRVIDWGDCVFDPGMPQGVRPAIEATIAGVLSAGVATLVLGGDHSATYPVLRAHVERHGPLALLHFDAHSDTWRDRPERMDHGTMFFHAAREGLLDVAHSVQVGIRTSNPETHGFHIIDADQVQDLGPAATVASIRERIGERPCYLSFDIDCLDPAFAPGTGTPVPGGLTSGQARRILRGLAGLDVRGMDIMEVAPAYDVSDITALAAAAIAVDLIGLYAARFPARPGEC